MELIDRLGVPADATLLDYQSVASEPHLRQPDGGFVDDPERLRPLLRRQRSGVLERAQRVFVPSRDMLARLRTLCPDLASVHAPPWTDRRSRGRHVFVPIMQDGEELRILVQGTLAGHKGLRLVLAAAEEASARKLPLRFHHLGAFAERGTVPPSLVLHGPFAAGAHSAALNAIAPHLGWLPAQVPETWSYVLSEFIDACLPVAGCALGALVERCHGRPATWLLPAEAGASEWVELFMTLHATRLRLSPRWAPVDHLPDAPALSLDDYLRPILTFAATTTVKGEHG